MHAQSPHIALLLMTLMARPTLYQATSDHPAVVLLYDENIETYTPVDPETIGHFGLLGTGKHKKVITCPAKHTETGKVSHDVLEVDIKEENDENRCEYYYTPSMVSNRNGSGFNVGFYFIEDKSIFGNKNLPLFSNAFDNTDNLPRMHIYDIETNRVTFQTTQTRHKIVSYEHFLYAIPRQCEKLIGMVEDGFGTGFIEDILARHYQREKQKKLLDGCQLRDDFFLPVQLVPINDFTDNASRQATCTYFNTVPIWSSVAGMIKNLEMFIRRVADVLDVGALEVVTRTFDILETVQRGKKDKKKLYLDFENETIPVPRIFMKIIHYRVAFPVTNHDDSNSMLRKYDDYYMIVGVYNTIFPNPYLEELEFNCNYNICLKYRWNLASEYRQNTRIFCCDIKDTSSLEALGLNNISGKLLDLNRIPVEIDENGEIQRSLQVPILR